MAIVVALIALSLIALVYAEVKYRFVSTIVSFVVANPLGVGVIALVVAIGAFYLGSRGKFPVQKIGHSTIVPSSHTDQEVPRSCISAYGDINPATREEYYETERDNAELDRYMRTQFPQQQVDEETLDEARLRIEERVAELLRKVDRARGQAERSATSNRRPVSQGDQRRVADAENDLIVFRSRIHLALYWLMNLAYLD